MLYCNWISGPFVTAGFSIGVGSLLGWFAWRRIKDSSYPRTWEEVGEVSEILIYPLKSARAVRKKSAQASTCGFSCGYLEDRSFMVVTEKGAFITSRQAGTLATVVTQVEGSRLTLKAKGVDDLVVDIENDPDNKTVYEARLRGIPVAGVDCGDRAAQWLTEVLYRGETRVRLLYKGSHSRQVTSPKYFDFRNFCSRDRVYYADEGSYMVSSQSSLNDLNSRLEEPVTIENFRPNIVVRKSSPYDEDDWIYVKIGQVVLRRLKPCERCILVTVDPVTGERHPNMEPLTTLRKYRLLQDPPELAKRWARSPIFGVTMSIDKTGPIATGDKVYVARASRYSHLRGF
ncbi:mitochondrial amidoxime-reducing component 1-like [Macrobrachium rosenbergii]|uniref:mitochondrial amidoxime-reducing component 1-like n=1 Tax=Macrobrachium rosenbergii TaxID=79674 RepID=UPI0034D6AACE